MLDLPQYIEPTGPYVANMRIFSEKNPDFAQKIDSVDESEIVACESTRNGQWTCQVEGNHGKAVYLHSRYNPDREAQQWANGVEELAETQSQENGKVAMAYMVDGFGLGYHVKALYERLEGETFIVVSEPNLALLRSAFERHDFSEMLDADRLLFITETDRSEVFKQLQQHSTVMMMGVVFTHPLQKVNTAFHAAVHKLVGDFTSFMRANLWTLLGCSMQTCKNLIHNLPSYVSTPSVEILKKRFAGKPAVCVAAGPSLRKNIAHLKTIRDRVVVIAVQTVLKPLLASGIEPDFVTSLDFYHVCKRFFEGVGKLPNVQLVAEPKAHWDVIDCYRDIGPMTLLWNEFASLLLDEIEDHHDHMTGGTTVAHLSFYLAEYLEADPIIFIGQDLGFTDNVYYAPGNALHDIWRSEFNRFCTIENKEWERIMRQGGSLRKASDMHGHQIYTDEEMFTYLQQFERDFAKSKAQIIDATEGGVKKEGAEVMTLKEAVDRYGQEPIDRERFSYLERTEWFNPAQLEKARDALEKRIDEVNAFKEVTVETIELVEEMLELLEDQPALNRKMIRLDELRGLVKQRYNTYKLIGYVSQTAELCRFRLDRTIGVQNKQGTERQRQQLLRDVGYVSDLKLGCDRMIELLKEGLERFEEELAKTDQHSAVLV
jgi:hypothetical protein